jgi:ubiquinone/menaquinone biosynthesis C-methylase UbiE
MQEVFLRYFPPGSSLLELNCGTGTDAIALAHHGMTIRATDDSPAMVAVARAKTLEAGLEGRISVERLSFHELSHLCGNRFHGAYSNFGGLNCLHDLSSLARDLSELLESGSHFSVCFMTRFCLWETVSFLLRFRWHRAFRRLRRNGVDARIHGAGIRVFYHSVASIVSTFRPWFETVEVGGLNIFTPPPVTSLRLKVLRQVLPFLESLDALVSRWPMFRSVGDHCYIVMRRTVAGSAP